MIYLIAAPTRFGAFKGHAWEWFKRNVGPLEPCALPGEQLQLSSDIKGILLLGPKALDHYFPNKSLDTTRGYPLPKVFHPDIPVIATYHPQDAEDFQASGSQGPEGFEKDLARTSPLNYRFWISQDYQKLVQGEQTHTPAEIVTYPGSDQIISIINSWKDEHIFLDIECRPGDLSLNCIGLAASQGPIYVIPVYRYTHKIAYSNIASIFAALARALRRNTVVVHNAMFDLFVLAWIYRIPCGSRIFDTMLTHHRCFPKVEKSLSHAMSVWTWLPFHKDLGIPFPKTASQDEQLWHYNALDVYGLREVFNSMQRVMASNPALCKSAAQANALIYPYLIMSLKGMNIDEYLLAQKKLELMRKQKILTRIIRILIGDHTFNPGSTQQWASFFYKKLGYKIAGRTQTGAPRLNEGDIYNLALKYQNPLMTCLLRFRSTVKTLGILNFNPYESNPIRFIRRHHD